MTTLRPAVVTGAGRGIGRACAIAFAKQGRPVALCGRSKDGLNAVAAEIHTAGNEAIAYVADVRDHAQLASMMIAIRDEYGHRPAVLVTCAVESRVGNFLDLTEQDWRAHYESKVLGTLNSVRAVLPGMIETGWGRIVTVAGTTARTRARGRATNGMTNASVANIAAHVAEEFAQSGVLINTVHPGYTDTPRLEMIAEGLAARTGITKAEARERLRMTIPSGRFTDPEEIAALATFLCSAQNCSITGQAIAVDGGMSAAVTY